MNTQLKLLLITLFLSSGVYAQSTEASLIKKLEGFSHPESVVFDVNTNEFYISNMADRKDGDGFISRVSAVGEIIDLKWITGLRDPKGLLVKEETLYVTNNTELVEISIPNESILRRIPVEGAKSLNDITVDETGNIFISDSGKSAIYLMPGKALDLVIPEAKEGEIIEYLNSKRLEYVNGLFAQDKQLYAAAWGENENGNFLKIDIDTREITKISKNRIGNLDGIQPAGQEAFYLSDWASGKIYLAGKNGDLTEVLTSEKSAGDIFFDTNENQLILPMNHQNAVWWYQLK
ncbi:SMP-30/gluconolactonase/LRE family protein [Salegentibacter maritimus]|uniref:Sugar lactone lactonase YvrE n=1 Tax=Salegentibacter maritimus TaxID=2794347 RepID=A0ABS0TCY2_9FLAO|nr:hypothetical protein [Salegentibacter maritimus]MBI6118904.1 hypothetical protein [Salegentibacter maritimus]